MIYLIYGIIAFFVLSLINDIIQIMRKKINFDHYFLYYQEYFIIIATLFFLFRIIGQNSQDSIIYSLFIASLTHTLILLIFQIKESTAKKLAKRMGVLKIKREIFHPISLNEYYFKFFKCHIYDPEKLNISRDYIVFNNFLNYKKKEERINHQFGEKNVFAFDIVLEGRYKKNHTYDKGYIENKKLVDKLMKISKVPVKTAFITAAYHNSDRLRITIKKDYCNKYPKRVLKFLESYMIESQMNKSR